MMRFFHLVNIFLVFHLTSCSKSQKNDESREFEVIEYKTNQPVTGATITLYKCTDYDFVYGCQQTGIVATYFTNSSGKASVLERDYSLASEGTEISKIGYWTQDAQSGQNIINKEGWINMLITRTNNYPGGSYFLLYNKDERLMMNRLVFSMSNLVDTTVSIKAYYGQANNLKWVVSDITGFNVYGSSTLPVVNVPAGVIPIVNCNY